MMNGTLMQTLGIPLAVSDSLVDMKGGPPLFSQGSIQMLEMLLPFWLVENQFLICSSSRHDFNIILSISLLHQ